MSLAPLWVTMAIILLSLTWLLPNHSRPWVAFHSDAWIALNLIIISLIIFVRAKQVFELNVAVLVLGTIALVPLLQYAMGLLAFAGQAWIATAYLLGFFLAFLIGQQWQGWRPLWMGDIIFSAIGIAALLSVALQLFQWVGLIDDSYLPVWVLNLDGERPYANMGQPNQLATLIILGILSSVWGVLRKQIGKFVALLTVSFLLVGLTLTQSRTGALGLFSLLIASWWWRRLWTPCLIHWYMTSLTVLYIILWNALGPTSRLLEIHVPISAAERINSEIRPQVWRMLLDAAWQQPFSGYGWNEVFSAQFFIAEKYPALNVLFMQSHNLFLDFILWVGIPIGIMLTLACLAWLVVAVRRANRVQHVIYLMWIVTMGIHSMLELPLHYAYFLFPTGLVIGALNLELNIGYISFGHHMVSRKFLFTVWLFLATILSLIIVDYFRVESSYLAFQIEEANIEGAEPATLPTVNLLTQLREAQKFAQFIPAGGASDSEIQWARDSTRVYPSVRNIINLAFFLGLNNRPLEAKKILIKMCLIVSTKQCIAASLKWKALQNLNPVLRSIEMPDKK